jgi:hypothetical protein
LLFILKVGTWSLSDRIRWRFEKDGQYTVTNAYWYCVEEAIDTSHLRGEGPWNLLWKAKLPQKVKNLMWSVCRNCLPTRTRLIQKGVDCPSSCILCDSG